MADKINPITNLPVVENINPITGLPVITAPRTTYPGKLTGMSFAAGDNSDFGNYGIDPLAYYNKEEERAQRQSAAEQWGNGLAKAGLTFVGAVAENTIGTALGLGDYIFSGFDSLSESMTNNPVGVLFDEAHEWAQKELPNYYTEEEMREQGTLGALGSANFWADKFANGAAYSLGSIASMYLTGGVGVVGGTLRAAGATAKMSKALAAYRVAKSVKAGKTIREAITPAKAYASNVVRGSEMLEASLMMSMAEAAVEARETKSRITEDLITEAKQRKAAQIGEVDWEKVQLDPVELENIHMLASEAEGAIFYGNMGVLAPTNLLMFGKMITPFRSGAGFNRIVKDATKDYRTYVEMASTLPKGLKQAYVAGRIAKPFIEGAITEGFQEGSQYAISQGISDYALRKNRDSGAGDLAESLMKTGRVRTLFESSADILGRAGESFKDKEAREQIMIGALVGLLTGGLGGVKQIKEKNKNTQSVLTASNDPNFYRLGAKAENVNAGVETIRRMLAANEAGDMVTYNILQNELITQQVLSHMELGSMDLYEEKLNDAKGLSDEEFKEAFGIDESYQFTDTVNKDTIVENLLNSAKKIEKAKFMVDSIFASSAVTGARRLFMSKEDKLKEEERLRDEKIYKNELIHQYSNLEYIDDAINNRLRELDLATPNFINKSKVQRFKRKEFGEVIINPDGSEQVVIPQDEKLETVISALEAAGKDLEGLKRFEYQSKVGEVKDLLIKRNTTALALDNLLKSPESRDLFISRTKAAAKAEVQRKLDAEVEALITSTSTVDDLIAAAKKYSSSGVSPEVQNKINEEVRKRKRERATIIKRFEKLRKSEVEALTDLSPLEEEARKLHLASRTQEEPILSSVEEATSTLNTLGGNTEDDQDDDSPTGTPSGGTVVAGGITLFTRGPQPLPTGVPNPTPRGGEFSLTEDGKVVVDYFTGKPVPSKVDNRRTLDGVPIIDGRDVLKLESVKPGTEVELVAIEDDYWRDEKDEPENVGKELENLPVYVKIDGVFVGAILGGSNPGRVAAVTEYLNAKREGREPRKVTTTILKKHANNQFSGRAPVPDGNGRYRYVPWFNNAYEVFGNVPVGVVRFSREVIGSKTVEVGNLFETSSEDQQAIFRLLDEVNLDNLYYGQVVFFFKDPNGEMKMHLGHTALLNEQEVEESLNNMSRLNMDEEGKEAAEEAYLAVKSLVGLNELPLEMRGPGPALLYIDKKPYQNDRIIRFTAPEKFFYEDKANNFTDITSISIQSKYLKRLLKAANEGLPITDIVKDVMSDKNVLGNLLVVTAVTEGGAFTTEGVGYNVLKSQADVEELLGGLVEQLTKVLYSKRRQVLVSNLVNNPNYFKTLANTEHIKSPKDDFRGFSGVIATDSQRVGPSTIIDIGLDLDPADVKIDGNPAPVIVSPITPTVDTSSKPSMPADDVADEGPAPGDFVFTDLSQLFAYEQELNAQKSSTQGSSTQSSPTPSQPNEPTSSTPPESKPLTGHVGDDADAPFRLGGTTGTTISREKAEKWLKDRGIPVEFYESALQVGSQVAHGYMKNATTYLWTNAEVGTEYHEAFHFVFRTLLNDQQREGLYKEARKLYAQSLKDKGINPTKATELQLEEEMAESFRDYVFAQQESAKTLTQKILKFFKDIWNYIRAVFINPIGVEQLFSLIEANKVPKKYERTFDQFKNNDPVYSLVSTKLNKDPKAYRDILSTLSHQFINEVQKLDAEEEASNTVLEQPAQPTPVTTDAKPTPVVKIISGGQTGADRLGLEIAKELGIETGGVAPRGYKTEKGNDSSLKEFGLSEDSSSDYNPRTEKNVKASDATVIFGDVNSAGSKLTVNLLNRNNKPYIVNPSAEELSNFLKSNNVKVLNVAGNRGSKLTPSQIEEYKNTLRTALQPTQPTISLEPSAANKGRTEQELIDYLQEKYPEIKLTITNTPVWEQGDNIFNQEEFNNQVQYRLKAVDLLLSDKAAQVFAKGEKSNWNLDKILTELAVPKEQKKIILDLGKTSREEILTDLLSSYSYPIEIYTAREDYKPTTYHSKLTVPGGTNYTENEIATPNITPSIKGHAQFATDNGIGWFRSDEEGEISRRKEEDWKLTYDEQVAKYGYVDGETEGVDEFVNKLNKTRRILEIQSDLFQKGRDKQELVGISKQKVNTADIFENEAFSFEHNNYFYDADVENIYYEEENQTEPTTVYYKNGMRISKKEMDEAIAAYIKTSIPKSNNQFLQLLNKDNNWVTFFIKSIIQDSAKQGYEKVLFPSGNTASKVEGHSTLEEFKKQKEDRISRINELIKEGNKRSEEFDPTTGEFYDVDNSKLELEKSQLKQELERVEKEGFGALRPIYNFYETTVTNILKKQGYNPKEVTDEYGNTWNEISINQARDLGNVLLQKDEAGKIIGQANIQAMTVLVDAVNKKADTIPHEYAHHYIAWFRDTPIVQEGIKRFGSEEALVQAIGEQVVKQKGEAYNWWKKFTNWLLNLLSDKQLLQILTDSFINRQDLNEFTYSQAPAAQPKQSKKSLVNELLGTDENNKGKLAEYFYSLAYSTANDERITDEQFEIIKGFGKDWAAIKDYLDGNNLKVGAPKTGVGVPQAFNAMSETNRLGNARIFYEIYHNWFDITDDRLGNVDSYGWRSGVIDDLKKYGYDIKGTATPNITETLNTEIGTTEEDSTYDPEETEFEKIHNITHFEQSPSYRVSTDVRRLFGKMVTPTPNFLGFYTFIDIDTSYKAAVHAAVGLRTFEEMKAAIERASRNHPELVAVSDYLKTKVTPEEAAKIRVVLGLDYANHKFLEETYDEDRASTVKIIGSDRRSGATAYMHQWKTESLQDIVERPAALFKVENGVDVINNNVIDGKQRLTHIQDAVKGYFATPLTDLQTKGAYLADLLWYMSMSFSNDQAQNRSRVIKHITDNPGDLRSLEGNTMFLLGKAFKTTYAKGAITSVELKQSPLNFFLDETSAVRDIAKMAANFTLPVAMAFVSGRGKTIYPYNTGSHFSFMMSDISKGKNSEMYQKLSQDPSISGAGAYNLRSIIYSLIENGNADFDPFSLDTLRDETGENNSEYTELKERESLILKLHAFMAGSKQYAYYSIPTQESRGRVDFIKLAVFDNPDSMKSFKLEGKTRKQLIAGIIIRDLIRMGIDPSVRKGIHGGFHLVGMEDRVLSEGLPMSQLAADAANFPNSEEYKEFYDAVNEMAKNFLDVTYKQYLQEFSQRAAELSLTTVKNDKVVTRLDSEKLKNFGTIENLLDSYAFNSIIAKVEISTLLRGSAVTAKNLEDFYKRMGLINTPGDRLMLQGEYLADPSYGFLKEVVQGVISKVPLKDKEHNKIAERYRNLLTSKVGKKVADKISDAYLNSSSADRTDGSAFISPIMFRALRQGEGKWTSKDDIWFNKYINNNGPWKAEYTPNEKFYYENLITVDGVTRPEMDKNSWFVLTREFVRGTDFYQDMYNRMMGIKEYEGMGYVHLINTVSAKKGYKGDVLDLSKSMKISGRFMNLKTRIQQGDKFLRPQRIDDKGKLTTKVNRQVRKGMLSAVEDATRYVLDGKFVTGAELKKMFHDAFGEIISTNTNNLLDEIGYTNFANNPNNKEARLNFLQNLKRIIIDSAERNGGVDSNTLDQLRIVEKDILDFALPLAFPAFQKKYQAVILSLFKNNVFNIELPGKELVMVPSPGKFTIGKEFRELRFTDISEDLTEIKAAEVMVSAKMLKKLGLKVGEVGLAYRIPHQFYSSSVAIKVVGVIPDSYSKTIIVPGNFVIQTGADFDIDKLFVLFRDTSEKPLAEPKNKILSILTALSLSPEHFADTISPLSQEGLNELASREEIYIPALKDFAHPLTELTIESNYKSAAKLVGIYANGLSGLSVAVHARGEGVEEVSAGLDIHPSKQIILVKNGEATMLDKIQARMKTNPNELTAYGINESLSAGLDAGKKLIHLSINDNEVTANARLFLRSIGMDDESIVYLMAHPLVREFVSTKQNLGKSSTTNKILREYFKISKDALKEMKNNTSMSQLALNFNTLKRVVKEKDRTSTESQDLFKVFVNAMFAGDELSTIYKVLTPDTVDGLNDLSLIEEYLDNLDSIRRKEETSLVSFEQIDSIINGDAYGLSKHFYKAIEKSLEVNSSVFLGGTKAVKTFKGILKTAIGKTKLTGAEHRFIDRMLFYYVLTQEGSPAEAYLNRGNIRNMLTDPNDNLYSQIKKAVKEIPSLNSNSLLGRVKEGKKFNDPLNRVFTIELDNTDKLTKEMKDDLKLAFHRLLFNPEIYSSDPAEQTRIKKIGHNLIANAIVTTGLAPTYGSYFDIIPVEAFLQPIKVKSTGEEISMGNFFSREFDNIQKDPNYFNDFVFDFIRNFGTVSIKGKKLLGEISKKQFESSSNDRIFTPKIQFKTPPPMFAIVSNFKKSIDKVSVYQWDGEKYIKLQAMGINGSLIELNLRDSSGISKTSMWDSGFTRTANVKTRKGAEITVKLGNRDGAVSMPSTAVTNLNKIIDSERASSDQSISCIL